jgi:hypothetical protein
MVRPRGLSRVSGGTLAIGVNAVVPLRGTRKASGSDSAGCAALHPQLFKGDRYAVATYGPPPGGDGISILISGPEPPAGGFAESVGGAAAGLLAGGLAAAAGGGE